MSSIEFVANGKLHSDAIKFYPRDANGAFISGVSLTLTGTCGGALLSNVRETTDGTGAQCLVADFTPPSSVPSGSGCSVQASEGGNSCLCDITYTAQSVDCNASSASSVNAQYDVNQTFNVTATVIDQNGDPFVDQSRISFVGNSAISINSETYNGNGVWTVSVTGTNAGAASIGIQVDAVTCFKPVATIIQTVSEISCLSTIATEDSGGYFIGQNGSLSLQLFDTQNNPITSGVSFQGSGVSIISSQLNNNEWILALTPGQDSWSIIITHNGENCRGAE